MAKTKTPFFSMGAKGSVGQAITAQTRGQATILRSQPLPTDPYSLPQAYQRWLYEDYAYLWTQQTNATKAEYRRDGVRHHLTAFQYWMRTMLRTMPDIVSMYHLDPISGAQLPDFSRNLNTATIFGASPATGLIDGAYLLDGINDVITAPDIPELDLTTIVSVEAFVRFSNLGTLAVIASKTDLGAGSSTFILTRTAANNLTFYTGGTGAANSAISPLPQPKDTWLHTYGHHDGTKTQLYIQGAWLADAVTPLAPVPNNQLLHIGSYHIAVGWLSGEIDHLIIRNRALDDTEILRHSLRRYPPQ